MTNSPLLPPTPPKHHTIEFPEEDIETTMTHLKLKSFDPDDPAEITRDDFREATNLVRRAARANVEKTRMAFLACRNSEPIRLSRRKKT